MNTLIGIDWSQNHHNVCFMNEAGANILSFQIPHSTQGLTKLEEHLTS